MSRRIASAVFIRATSSIFELNRGFLIAANDEKDARRIERLLAQRVEEHRTHAPLVIERAAGGSTEWYRGAYPLVLQASAQLVTGGGYPPLISTALRLQEALLREREHLFEYATAAIDTIDALGENPAALPIAAAFRNSLDAFRAFAIAVDEFLPEEITRRFA